MAPRRKAIGGAGESNAPKIKLIVEKGPLAGQSNVFGPGARIKIGRVVRGNKLCIKDPGISSKHLAIEVDSGSDNWTVTDLGSSNGTILNDRLLDSDELAILSEGDFIKIGELTSIKVTYDVGEVALESVGGQVRRNARRGVRNKVVELVAIDEANGTILNDRLLDSDELAILSEGDIIKIGELTSIKVTYDVGEVALESVGGQVRRNARRGVRNKVVELVAIDEVSELGLVEELVTGEDEKVKAEMEDVENEGKLINGAAENGTDQGEVKWKSRSSRNGECLVELSVNEPKVSLIRKISAVSEVELVHDSEKVGDLGVKKGKGRGKSRNTRKEESLVELSVDEPKVSVMISGAVSEVALVDHGEKVEEDGVKKGKGSGNRSYGIEESLIELISEMRTSSAVPEVELVGDSEKVESEGVNKGNGRRTLSMRNTRGSKKVAVEEQRVSARVTRNSKKEEVLVDSSIIEGKGKRKVARGKTNVTKDPTVEDDSKGELLVEQEVHVEKTVSVAVGSSSVVDGVETGEEGVARIAKRSGIEEAAAGEVGTSGVKHGVVETVETSGQGVAGYVKGKSLKDLDSITMGEWFNFLEVFLPHQIIIETEKAISEMEDKARKLHEFRLQHMRAKEKAGDEPN